MNPPISGQNMRTRYSAGREAVSEAAPAGSSPAYACSPTCSFAEGNAHAT